MVLSEQRIGQSPGCPFSCPLGTGKGGEPMARQRSLKEIVEGWEGRTLPKKINPKKLINMAMEEDKEPQCYGDCQNCEYAEECVPATLEIVGAA
jgi:hypothetical protein